jgi:quinol monooxygenase YgiN
MIAAVATMHVREDKADEFVAAVTALERAVAANEPDCLLYRFARDRNEPGIYRSLEIFRDQAAIDFHIAQDHFREGVGAMRACLTETPSTVEFMDTLS